MHRLKHLFLLVFCLALVGLGYGWQSGVAQTTPTFQQQVERYASHVRGTQALAALLITPDGTEMAFAGDTGNPDHPVPTADTLFEIGSITKVFTALLLADQVNQGAMTLDTPVGKLLPENFAADPELPPIPLQTLTSHTSGLPRLPLSRMLRASLYPANPYRGSQPAELYRAIGAISPEAPAHCEYSNVGPALLGQLLATSAGRPYTTLLKDRVLVPLGLTDTAFELDPESTRRLAQGHQENTLPTASWQLDAYAPAGGLKSTLTDMGRFLAAAIAADWPPLALSLQPYSEGCEPTFGLGWIFTELEDAPMIMHNGGTGGYYAFLGWLPEAGRGLVLLTNRSDAQGDQVATALLSGQPLPARDRPLSPLMVAAFLGGLLIFQGWQFARSQRHRDRFQFLEDSTEILFLLALSYQLGPWQWLPIALWWALLVLFIGLIVSRLWHLRALPPAAVSPQISRWRSLRLLPTLLLLGWTIFCLR
jgi:CubicO group peptidase (beta-lactamase class C family)